MLSQNAVDVTNLRNAIATLTSARGMFTLDPIRKLLNDPNVLPLGSLENSPINLLIAVVSLETGDLRYVNQHGGVLRADAATPYSEVGSLPPACQGPASDLTAAVDDLGLVSRTDFPTQSGYLRALATAKAAVQDAQQALATCMKDNAGVPPQLVVAVPDAVLASSSLPLIFIPIKLGKDNYVDAGIRAPLPIAGAISAGASTVWAIAANHVSISQPMIDLLTHNPVTTFDQAWFLQIAQRAGIDIMPTQIEQDSMNPLAAWGQATVTVVQPEDGTFPPDIHSGLSVDPGLVQIRIAHGYMRTDDVNTARELRGNGYLAVADQISALLHTTEIVNLRWKIWLREYDFFGWLLNITRGGNVQIPLKLPLPLVDPLALADIRSMKQQLQLLVQLRLLGISALGDLIVLDRHIQGAVPDQPVSQNDWWLKWEAHQFPTLGDPWVMTSPSIPFSPLPLPVLAPQIDFSSTGSTNSPMMTISEFTAGASVFYTLDNSDPTPTPTLSNQLYHGALQVDSGKTVKARAFTAGGGASPITTKIVPLFG
jgi:hypothetical protein